jgi:uncharacterized alkaline shock family protein YloU
MTAVDTMAGRYSDVLGDPATRGSLQISEKAIEKIASHIAANVPGITGTQASFLGIGPGRGHQQRPKVDVHLAGLVASLTVSAGVRYPAPLRASTERLRQELKDKVAAACGIDVRQVDINLEWLVTPAQATVRRELL